MARIIPIIPSGIQYPRLKNASRTIPKAVVMPPTATPNAATVPTSIFLTSAFGDWAAASSPPIALASASDARLAICSLAHFTMRL